VWEIAGLFVSFLGVALVLLGGAVAIYRSVLDKKRSSTDNGLYSDN